MPDSLPDESAEDLYEMAPCGYLSTTIDGRIVFDVLQVIQKVFLQIL